MTLVNAFSQFNRGLLSGAGFSLGVGLSNFVNNSLFGFNMSFNPFSSFGCFNPFMSLNLTNSLGYYMGFNLGMSGFNNQPRVQNYDFGSNASIFSCNAALPANTGFVNNTGLITDSFINSSSVPFGVGGNFFGGLLALPPIKDVKGGDKTKNGKGYDNNVANGAHAYASLRREDALKKAKADSNLEELSQGEGWSISKASFINDIPYARKGTGELLTKVCKNARVTLTVTSALGTANSPHDKNITGAESHYNELNPKLDLGGGLTAKEAQELKSKLEKTGCFSRIVVESDGETSHLDVQFKDSEYEELV